MSALGTTRIRDLEVTRLGLGTAPLGGLFTPVDEATAIATVGRAHELGIRFFDTAPLYGYGTAERRLGEGLRSAGVDDDPAIVVETKIGRLIREVQPGDGHEVDTTQLHEGEPFYKDTGTALPVFDYTYDGAMRAFDETLERLGLDHVGLLQVHDPDEHIGAAISGACRAAIELRDQGVVSAVGVATDYTETATAILPEVDLDMVLIAGRWSLLDHGALDTLLPLASSKNVRVIAAGVFNSGVLTGGTTFDYVPAPNEVVERVARFDAVCGRYDIPLAAAALQFPLRHPAVASVLIGARSPQEVEENVARFTLPIPDALWHDLETVCGLPDLSGVSA